MKCNRCNGPHHPWLPCPKVRTSEATYVDRASIIEECAKAFDKVESVHREYARRRLARNAMTSNEMGNGARQAAAAVRALGTNSAPTRDEAIAWSKAGPEEPEGPLAGRCIECGSNDGHHRMSCTGRKAKMAERSTSATVGVHNAGYQFMQRPSEAKTVGERTARIRARQADPTLDHAVEQIVSAVEATVTRGSDGAILVTELRQRVSKAIEAFGVARALEQSTDYDQASLDASHHLGYEEGVLAGFADAIEQCQDYVGSFDLARAFGTFAPSPKRSDP